MSTAKISGHRPDSLLHLIRSQPKAVPSWIEPAILPKGGKMIMGGEAKIGKSLILLEMMYALATGEPWMQQPRFNVPERARTLLLEKEVGEYGLGWRVRTMFNGSAPQDLEALDTNSFFVAKDPKVRLADPEGMALVRHYLDAVEPNVLLLDPVGKLHRLDENRADDMNALFDCIDELINEYRQLDLSVVFTHHFRKNSNNSAFDPNARDELDPYNFRGSTRWVDDPDAIMTAVKKKVYRDEREDFKWWEDNIRFTLRHGEQPDDMKFSFNQFGDMRVRFLYSVDEKGRRI